MTITDEMVQRALPALPEPTASYANHGHLTYSAKQMREYARAALTAALGGRALTTNSVASHEPAKVRDNSEFPSFQARVAPWMAACFGLAIAADRLERADRLIEEVLELVQSGDYPRERVAALTDYVYSRPPGEPAQEVGGVMVTLAAYCLAHNLDMQQAAETELARIWTKVVQIRAKQAAKPTGSALPIAWAFAPGQRVEKWTGEALWSGIIVARYLTTKGKERYVVEVEPQGFQMIAVPSQLRAAAAGGCR